MTLNWGFSFIDLGNAVYTFITITTLTKIDSTSWIPFMGQTDLFKD